MILLFVLVVGVHFKIFAGGRWLQEIHCISQVLCLLRLRNRGELEKSEAATICGNMIQEKRQKKMSKIIKPYVADCRIGNENYENLEVVDLNNKSVWLRLPNGELVKRHVIRHRVDIKYITPVVGATIGGKIERVQPRSAARH